MTYILLGRTDCISHKLRLQIDPGSPTHSFIQSMLFISYETLKIDLNSLSFSFLIYIIGIMVTLTSSFFQKDYMNRCTWQRFVSCKVLCKCDLLFILSLMHSFSQPITIECPLLRSGKPLFEAGACFVHMGVCVCVWGSASDCSVLHQAATICSVWREVLASPAPSPRSRAQMGRDTFSCLSLSWWMLVHGGGRQGAWLTSLSHSAYRTSSAGWWPKLKTWLKSEVMF